MFCTRAPFRRLPRPSLSGSLRSACHVITGLLLRVLRISSVLNSIFFLGVALEKVCPRMRNSNINPLVSTSFTLGYILRPFHSSPLMWFLSFGGSITIWRQGLHLLMQTLASPFTLISTLTHFIS